MRRDALLLAVLALVGLALRLRGLDWGLPWALHIDERLFVAAKAIRLERSVAEGALPDPGISSYGILPLWLLVLARKLLLGATAQPGPPTYGDDFAATLLLARGISAAAGAAAVVLTGLWARRFGRATALLAAAMVAGFPALVQAGHFGTVESLLAAAIAGGLLAIERAAERPTTGRVVAAGALLGLALSVKAPAAALALPLVHAAGAGGRRVARSALAAATAVLVVAALNPALLAGGDPGARTGEHTTLLGNLRRAFSPDFHDWTLPYAHDLPGWTEATKLLPYAIGVVPEILALVGLVVAMRRRAPRDVRLLLFAVPLLALLLAARVKTVRFLVPVLPAIAVLAAEGLVALASRGTASVRAAAAAAVAALALLHGLAFTAIYAETDPRVAAARWLDAHAGPRDIVVVEDPPGYGPPVGSPAPAIERPALRYEMLWRNYYAYDRGDDAARRKHIVDVVERAAWLALSEGHRRSFTTAPELRPVESAFYRHLDDGTLPFEKVAEFATYPRLGPWKFRDDGAEVLFRIFDHPRVEIWRRTDR